MDYQQLQKKSIFDLSIRINVHTNDVIAIIGFTFGNLGGFLIVFSRGISRGWMERSKEQSVEESERWHGTDMFWFDIKSVAKVKRYLPSKKDRKCHFNPVRLSKKQPYCVF